MRRCQPPKTNSYIEYRANLYILQAIMDKYEEAHTIAFCGDMHGSLIKESNNSQDKKLTKYI